jgi:accessory gene regulator B
MIEHLSRLIAKSLYNNTAEKSSSEEIEMLQYGIECIINILIPLIIIFIYAFLSHKTLDMFIWFLSFLLLRNFIGGYHTSSHIRCIILSSFVGILSIILISNMSTAFFIFKILIIVLLFTAFLMIGPMLQNQSYIYMKQSLRKKAIWTFLIYIASIFLLFFLNIQYWTSLYIGTISACVLYLIEFLIRKYKSNYKTET